MKNVNACLPLVDVLSFCCQTIPCISDAFLLSLCLAQLKAHARFPYLFSELRSVLFQLLFQDIFFLLLLFNSLVRQALILRNLIKAYV